MSLTKQILERLDYWQREHMPKEKPAFILLSFEQKKQLEKECEEMCGFSMGELKQFNDIPLKLPDEIVNLTPLKYEEEKRAMKEAINTVTRVLTPKM